MATATLEARPQRLSLLRVLGPGHVWALGVGIVLVGEFMGWNFSVGKGGALGSLIACWVCATDGVDGSATDGPAAKAAGAAMTTAPTEAASAPASRTATGRRIAG